MANRQHQHTIVALERSVRLAANKTVTDLYHQVQHTPNFMGQSRRFESTVEEVENEPAETVRPRLRSDDILATLKATLHDAWNLHATRDKTNMAATGTISIDGMTIEDVPVSTLLSLEKQLVNLRTVVEAMPPLDPAIQWDWDDAQQLWRSDEMRKARTKAIPKGAILAPATERHPAQVERYTDNMTVGHVVTTSFSGAILLRDKENLLDRINKLIRATKAARTEANMLAVEKFEPAGKLLDYLFPAG